MQDGMWRYKVGDEFPRKGLTVLPSRLKELASKENRQGCPLIEEVPDVEEKPKKKRLAEKVDEE